MTTPRDALRALEQIATEMRNSQEREASSDIVAACIDAWQCRLTKATDELAAIVSQMDSEPTVAQCEPDYLCCACGKPGNWGDCRKGGFRPMANAIGYYACSDSCELAAKDKP